MSGGAALVGDAPRPPRVLYLGYGACGCACLADLLAAGFEVAGVLCRASDRTDLARLPPTPAPRQAVAERVVTGQPGSSVFSYARQQELHCFADTDPGSPAFLNAVRGLAPDLLLSIQYDRILKPPLLALPRHGAYNLHFGPLPRLRGCFPTKWAILGDEPAGVTFHVIDPGIDTGDVVDQTVVPLAPDETDATLYHKLQAAAVPLFRRQLPWLRELRQPPRRPQLAAEASYHPKQIPYDGIIDWSRDAVWVERFVRAFTFPPYPAARTWWHGEAVEIRAPVALGGDLPGAAPGDLVLLPDGAIAVACGAGSLHVREVWMGGAARPASGLAPDPAGGARSAFGARPA
jgi:methionyl-tRNA formyltransferase